MSSSKKKRLSSKLPLLAVSFIITVAVAAMLILYGMQMLQVDKNILKNGNLLLKSYITDTRDSIEKGQRKTFQDAMNKIAKLKDVQSVSLYTKDRLMVYKSGEVTIGKPFVKKEGHFFNPNLELYEKSKGMYLRDDWSIRAHSMIKHKEKYDTQGKKCSDCHYQLDESISFDKRRKAYEIKENSSYFYHDIEVERECISCHTYWKVGDSAGYLSLKMDNRDIVDQVQGNIFNFVIVLSVVILLFLIIGYYIQLLNKRIEAKSKEVEIINKKINNLLNNAGQGFLSFGIDFFISSEYSKECELLLGSHLEGKDIAKLLFKEDPKKLQLFKDSINSMMQEQDLVIRRSIMSLLPKTISLDKKVLNIEYKTLDNDQIMLILTNITVQRKLEEKIKKEQEDLKMIVAVASDAATFRELKDEYEKFSKEKLSMVHEGRTFLHHVRKFYQIIHTFKGSFSQFYMHNCVHELHVLESRLSEFIEDGGKSGEDMKQLLSEYDFLSFLEKDLVIIQKTLGDAFLRAEDTLQVKKKYLDDLQQMLLDLMHKDSATRLELQTIYRGFTKLISKKLIDALKIYPKLSMDIAKRIGKEIEEFEIKGDENILMQERLRPFIKSLIHVFRNSVDHGIETAERRCELGKEEKGRLSCSVQQIGDELQIMISDDGAGIDIEALKAHALAKGMKSEAQLETLTVEELYEMIFWNQLSTKKEVSNLSGRGVGMSAVKTELDKLKGRVLVESEKDRGTLLTFTIPSTKEDENE